MDRRSFLRSAGAAILGGSALQALASCASPSGPSSARSPRPAGYGELQPTKDLKDGVSRLALPAGFRYVTLGIEATPMSDGVATPRAHDGMAAFDAGGGGRVRLVRNHEARDRAGAAPPIGDPKSAYDAKGSAGTTTIELRIAGGGEPAVVKDFVSLGGTTANCAGGPTPWGSWLTCEEAFAGQDQGFEKPHGYVFEVPARADGQADPVALTAMGRFVHEAVAIDPSTGFVYMTEDSGEAGFYRYLPAVPRQLARGGKLQMLAVDGAPNTDTRTDRKIGDAWDAIWVDIDEPDPGEGATAVFLQGKAKGGAAFARLEGAWSGRGSVFFNATSGGDAHMGQVWEYRPRARDRGRLRLVFESPGPDVLAMPDNITVTPRGGLLLCEDSDQERQHLRGLTADGTIFDFAANLVHDGEWAGATFSPQGRTLFANIQGDRAAGGPGMLGMTFAIWGPWERGAL